MGLVSNLWKRLADTKTRMTAAPIEQHDDDRRLAPRFVDGATAEIITSEQRAVASGRGRHLTCPAQTTATIVDVNGSGARLQSRQLLPLERRLWCRVDFLNQKMDLGMKIVWSRRTEDGGYEYGARYTPIVPGTEYLLDNYTQLVLNRRLGTVVAAR